MFPNSIASASQFQLQRHCRLSLDNNESRSVGSGTAGCHSTIREAAAHLEGGLGEPHPLRPVHHVAHACACRDQQRLALKFCHKSTLGMWLRSCSFIFATPCQQCNMLATLVPAVQEGIPSASAASGALLKTLDAVQGLAFPLCAKWTRLRALVPAGQNKKVRCEFSKIIRVGR